MSVTVCPSRMGGGYTPAPPRSPGSRASNASNASNQRRGRSNDHREAWEESGIGALALTTFVRPALVRDSESCDTSIRASGVNSHRRRKGVPMSTSRSGPAGASLPGSLSLKAPASGSAASQPPRAPSASSAPPRAIPSSAPQPVSGSFASARPSTRPTANPSTAPSAIAAAKPSPPVLPTLAPAPAQTSRWCRRRFRRPRGDPTLHRRRRPPARGLPRSCRRHFGHRTVLSCRREPLCPSPLPPAHRPRSRRLQPPYRPGSLRFRSPRRRASRPVTSPRLRPRSSPRRDAAAVARRCPGHIGAAGRGRRGVGEDPARDRMSLAPGPEASVAVAAAPEASALAPEAVAAVPETPAPAPEVATPAPAPSDGAPSDEQHLESGEPVPRSPRPRNPGQVGGAPRAARALAAAAAAGTGVDGGAIDPSPPPLASAVRAIESSRPSAPQRATGLRVGIAAVLVAAGFVLGRLTAPTPSVASRPVAAEPPIAAKASPIEAPLRADNAAPPAPVETTAPVSTAGVAPPSVPRDPVETVGTSPASTNAPGTARPAPAHTSAPDVPLHTGTAVRAAPPPRSERVEAAEATPPTPSDHLQSVRSSHPGRHQGG